MLSSRSAHQAGFPSSLQPNPSTHVGPADSLTCCIHFAGGWALGWNRLPSANGGRPHGAEVEVERLGFWQKDSGSLSGPPSSSHRLIIHCHSLHSSVRGEPRASEAVNLHPGDSNTRDRCNLRANSGDQVCPQPAPRRSLRGPMGGSAAERPGGAPRAGGAHGCELRWQLERSDGFQLPWGILPRTVLCSDCPCGI